MDNNHQLEADFQLLKTLFNNYPHPIDMAVIEKGWQFAVEAHRGQKRLTGEPYVNHPLQTAIILARWKLDQDAIIAGLLHDVIEDAGIKRSEINRDFSKQVGRLVEGVTKISNIKLRGSVDQVFVENLRKMFLAMAKDIRVVLVKLADRTHNMRTLYALDKDRQKKIAKETLEIYAPLAERLGMGEVKTELEDLAFPYVYPGEYNWVKSASKNFYREAEKHIDLMKRGLLTKFRKEKIEVRIHARKKHFYSLWRKLEREEVDRDFDKIHDIVAMRILVDKTVDCYSALGIVHGMFKPVPHIGISDFIAQPKPNGYRSIHTKVFGPKGRIVEVQIRTYRMHEEAEWGVAAHWVYSEIKSKGVSDSLLEEGAGLKMNKFWWVRELIGWQKQFSDTKDYLAAVKIDILKHRNFIFSPNGDVYDLPAGATPIDFAYAVHTDLPNFIKGAKVNGKMVPLNYQLKSGDVVEIVKSKERKKPNRDWLNFAVTALAKREIKKSN